MTAERELEALEKIAGGHFPNASTMVVEGRWHDAFDALQGIARAAIAAAEAELAPGHTDLMVPPETIGPWLEENPLPAEVERERRPNQGERMAYILKGVLKREGVLTAEDLDRVAELIDAPKPQITDEDRQWAADTLETLSTNPEFIAFGEQAKSRATIRHPSSTPDRERIKQLVRDALNDATDIESTVDRIASALCWLAVGEPPRPAEGVPEGWKLVPVEPSSQQLADMMLLLIGDEPNARDFAKVGAVLELLPPTGHPDARNVIADMVRDYRAMLASAPPPPPLKGE